MNAQKASQRECGQIRYAFGTMDRTNTLLSALKIQSEQSSYLDHERTLNRSAFVLFMVGTAVMIVVLLRLQTGCFYFSNRGAMQPKRSCGTSIRNLRVVSLKDA